MGRHLLNIGNGIAWIDGDEDDIRAALDRSQAGDSFSELVDYFETEGVDVEILTP